jgi:class 3 adenylate cyclase
MKHTENKAEIKIEDRVILFIDVHNFSAAIKRLDEHPHKFLQAMYEALGDIIVEHDGEIVKYLGDSMLCVFPSGSEKKAVNCSFKLRKAFAALIQKEGLPAEIELEVGISSGPVAAGIFGHRSLRQRDYFGDAINCAVMIGHHRGIAVTERVYEMVRSEYKTRRLPGETVKRRDGSLNVWEVTGRIQNVENTKKEAEHGEKI